MSKQGSGDARQRALHELVRRVADSPFDAPIEPDLDEIGALVSGTLLSGELRLVENRILVDEACAARVAGLYRDYEAGAVSTLIRRTRSVRIEPESVAARLLRRYGTAVLAIAAFLVVGALPLSIVRCGGTSTLEMKERALVIAHLGTPVFLGEDGGPRRPARAGAWLRGGHRLELEQGDMVEGVLEDGTRVRWTLETLQDPAREPPTDLLRELHADALKLAGRTAALGPPPEGEPPPARILTPRGPVLDPRPSFSWRVGRGVEVTTVRLVDIGTEEVLFELPAEGDAARYPPDRLPLAAGSRFRVELASGRSVLTSGEVEVKGGETARRLRAELEQLERLVGRGAHVLKAICRARAGLWSEAREEFDVLQRADPDNPALLRLTRLSCRELGLTGEERRLAALEAKRFSGR